ncbi:glycine/D-amino acid oxidase-like deaminating enzyme [Bacillus sp. OAE603]
MKKKVVILGGGITGLTAAYYLKQEQKKTKPSS